MRADAVAWSRAGGGADGVFVERQDDGAIGADPFAHGNPVAARDQRVGSGELKVEGVVAQLRADLEDVAVALGREQADGGARGARSARW